MDATTQQIGILIITAALVMTIIFTQFARVRRGLANLRTIPAYETLPTLVGLSIESNHPVHLSLGSSGIGGGSTLLTLASAELLYQVAQRAAIGDISPILTMSDASALPIGQDVLRRAYRNRNRLSQYRYSSARWYPSGSRSLAFAAALTAMTSTEDVSSNIFTGRFGPELALMLDANVRRELPSIVSTDELEGQAVAFAMATYPLIGEEVFTAGAYLGRTAAQIGATITLDLLRWLLVVVLILAFVITLLNGA